MADSKPPAKDQMSEAIDTSKSVLTADELISKLRAALRRDGDFPASAKIVSELRALTSDPKTTANQITEIILREPSLGTRVLHLVNSSFYRRAKPIMTVSQAVIQIGMRPLAEMCAGLVLLQKFVPAARRGGSFANCLRKTVLTSLLSSSITSEASAAASVKSGRNDEYGYLAGSFTELGTLLLAYYFPQVYETAVKRAETKKQEIGQSILDITGLSPIQLSLEVIDALDLPAFYKEVLTKIEQVSGQKTAEAKAEPQGDKKAIPAFADVGKLSQAVAASRNISEVIVSNRSKQELDKVIGEIQSRFGIEAKIIGKVVGDLPTIFRNHCLSIDLQLPSLPEYVSTYSEESAAQTAGGAEKADDDGNFSEFLSEIRQAVENREPTSSIITSVMETLAWSLKFDRVLLLLVGAGKTKLIGRLLLGNVPNFDPKKLSRPAGADAPAQAPDARAFKESRPVFNGEALFPHGWPLAAVPIGFGARAIGVIYADRDPQKMATPQGVQDLSAREQAAIGVLAELLDRSISLQT